MAMAGMDDGRTAFVGATASWQSLSRPATLIKPRNLGMWLSRLASTRKREDTLFGEGLLGFQLALSRLMKALRSKTQGIVMGNVKSHKFTHPANPKNSNCIMIVFQ